MDVRLRAAVSLALPGFPSAMLGNLPISLLGGIKAPVKGQLHKAPGSSTLPAWGNRVEASMAMASLL
jgi:hypothetical protein